MQTLRINLTLIFPDKKFSNLKKKIEKLKNQLLQIRSLNLIRSAY